MSARPRPVTATVTKPVWMQVPEADAAAYRRFSLTSNGSTASLTSVLDHDSYVSEPDLSEGNLSDKDNNFHQREEIRETKKENGYGPAKEMRKIKWQNGKEKRPDSVKRCQSTEGGLSAWEDWLIRKAKEEREHKRMLAKQKMQEKLENANKSKDKEMKLTAAEKSNKEKLRKKNAEKKLQLKMEKLKLENEERLKQETEQRIRRQAEKKFAEWVENKQKEEKERKQKEKEQKEKEEQARKMRQEEAEKEYQKWLKKNAHRPQSAPHSVLDYYKGAAYPKPSFINPIPWKHPEVPNVKLEKPQKTKSKKYVWNPNKYY